MDRKLLYNYMKTGQLVTLPHLHLSCSALFLHISHVHHIIYRNISFINASRVINEYYGGSVQ